MLEVKELSKSFDGIKAVSNLSFSLTNGEILGMIGPNGSGKTTVLDLITGLQMPDEGEIKLDSIPIQGLLPFEIASKGLVRTFQHPRVFRQLSLIENILLSVKDENENLWNTLFLKWRRHEREKRKKAEYALAEVGLEKLKDKKAFELSYGQMKRLEFSRALINEEAKVFLFDEPTSGLDPEITEDIIRILLNLKIKRKAIIVVEHNIELIKDIADRILVLNHGEKIKEGSSQEVLEDPIVLESFTGKRSVRN